MNENERCPECGSWGEECAFPTAQAGCGCARCLRAQRDEARAARDHFKEQLRERAEALLDARAEVERLRGLVPDLPPRPSEGAGLIRYGIRHNGPTQPLAVPMIDGHWTPWNLADAALRTVAERQREACAERMRLAVDVDAEHLCRATPLVTEGHK